MRGFLRILLVVIFVVWNFHLLVGLGGAMLEAWSRMLATISGGILPSLPVGRDARPATACRIKGNISISGEWFYHLPGDRDYAATRIGPVTGARWFSSERETRAAGWRHARRRQNHLCPPSCQRAGATPKNDTNHKKFTKNSIALIWIKAKIDKAT
ncbi:MAG: hypothetical protein D6757_00815 [Alphaproteobacteria bacterium]|nr:MAG: hypothetical protein D6757_00815 [Alphaproteobacteria bacterium]